MRKIALLSAFSIYIYIWCTVLILALVIIMPIKGITMSYSNAELSSVRTEPSVPGILEQREFLYFSAAMVLLVSLLGIIGNALTIATIVFSPKVRSEAASFIINLCVTDLIFCCLNLPFAAARFINQGWVHESAVCILFPFLRYLNVGITLLTIAVLAINRCMRILTPDLHQKVFQTFHICIMVASMWFVILGIMMPSMLGKWGRFGYDPEILTCKLLETNGSHMKVILFTIGFVLPCLIVAVCYGLIFRAVRKSPNRILRRNKSPAIISDHRDQETKLLKEDIEITRMVLFIFFGFLLCYVPLVVIKVVDPDIDMPKTLISAYLLLYFSAAINPVIYALTSKNYREAYKKIILCQKFPKTRIVGAKSREPEPEKGRNRRVEIPLVAFPIDGRTGNELAEENA